MLRELVRLNPLPLGSKAGNPLNLVFPELWRCEGLMGSLTSESKCSYP